MRFWPRLIGALLIGITLVGATAARAQEDDTELPGSKVRSAPPVPAQPLYSRRAYARGTMVVAYFLPGVYSDFGGERTPAGGLWAGGGLTLVNSPLPLVYVPIFRAHTTLGYSGRYFAVGGNLGGGAGYSFVGIGSIDLGLALRFGRVDGVHASLLLYWWMFPTIHPFPMGGEFSLLAPVGTGSFFHLDLRGDGRLGIWGGGTVGAKHLISTEPRGATFITWGVGAAWQYPFPGLLIQVGYEYRH